MTSCNWFISDKTYVLRVVLEANFSATYRYPMASATIQLNKTLSRQVLCEMQQRNMGLLPDR